MLFLIHCEPRPLFRVLKQNGYDYRCEHVPKASSACRSGNQTSRRRRHHRPYRTEIHRSAFSSPRNPARAVHRTRSPRGRTRCARSQRDSSRAGASAVTAAEVHLPGRVCVHFAVQTGSIAVGRTGSDAIRPCSRCAAPTGTVDPILGSAAHRAIDPHQGSSAPGYIARQLRRSSWATQSAVENSTRAPA